MRATLAERVINAWSRGEARFGHSGETKVLCPSCRHMDHNGYPTLNFNVTKGVGRCVYCYEVFTVKRLIADGNLAGRVAKGLPAAPPRAERAKQPTLQPPSEALWTPLHLAKGIFAEAARKYLGGRGVTEDMLLKYSVALGKQDRLWGRIIFPLYEDHQLVYYQARAIGKGTPKYLNPTETDDCLGKSHVVGYIDLLEPGDPFVITEGLMSAWGASALLGCPAVALLGKTISDAQVVKLANKRPGRCTLMLDPDVEQWQIRDVYKKLNSWGIPCDIVFLKEETGDPWDMYVTKFFKH